MDVRLLWVFGSEGGEGWGWLRLHVKWEETTYRTSVGLLMLSSANPYGVTAMMIYIGADLTGIDSSCCRTGAASANILASLRIRHHINKQDMDIALVSKIQGVVF
jgi:hypothetical protein